MIHTLLANIPSNVFSLPIAQYSTQYGRSDDAGGPAFVMIMLGALCFGILISVGIAAVIAYLLSDLLKRVPQPYRRIEPNQCWLLLIPLFQLYWNFVVYLKIPESLKAYFDSTGQTDVGDCGRQLGQWFAICAACCIVPCVNYIAGPAALVLLIIFLVKVLGLKSRLPAAPVNVGPPPAM